MNKIILALILLYFFSPKNSYGSEIRDDSKKKELYGTLYSFPNIYDGSPYLFKDWSFTSLSLTNGNIVENVRVKYNILTSDIIFYHEKFRKLFSIDKATVNSFTMNYKSTDSLYFAKYYGNDVSYYLKKNEIVHVLYNGNLKLLVKHAAYVSKANEINTKDKISPKNIYFIQNGDKTSEVKLRLKSVYKLFPENKQELKKIVAENKIKNKSEKDFIKLIELIDKKLK